MMSKPTIAASNQTDLEEAVYEMLLDNRLEEVGSLAEHLYTLAVRATCAGVVHTPAELLVVQRDAARKVLAMLQRPIERLHRVGPQTPSAPPSGH